MYNCFLETSPLVTFRHDFNTDIDYIHWQSCGEDVLMYIMAINLLSYDRERLKNYINVTCTIQNACYTNVIYALSVICV